MPIQTRGFGVDVMPQYTAADPRLVAFNPTAISDGAMTAFQMQRMRQDIEAKRALMEELEATRQKRIAAQNIGYDVNVAQGQKNLRQMPTVEEIEGLKFGAERQLIQPQTDLSLERITSQRENLPFLAGAERAKAQFDTAKTQALGREMPALVTAEVEEAKARAAEAKRIQATAPARGEYEVLSYDAKFQDLLDAEQVRADKLELAEKQLKDALSNFKDEADLKRKLQRATATKLEAEAARENAYAKFLESGGSSGKKKDPNEVIGNLALALQKLQNSTYTLPDGSKGNLAIYKGEVYDESGKAKTTRSGGGILDFSKKPIRKDAAAEAAIRQERVYLDLIDALSRRVGADLGVELGVDASALNQQSGGNAPAPQPSNAIISTKAEYDALPKGARFTGKDGKEYIKP